MVQPAAQSDSLVSSRSQQARANGAPLLSPRTDSAPARLTWEIPKGERQ